MRLFLALHTLLHLVVFSPNPPPLIITHELLLTAGYGHALADGCRASGAHATVQALCGLRGARMGQAVQRFCNVATRVRCAEGRRGGKISRCQVASGFGFSALFSLEALVGHNYYWSRFVFNIQTYGRWRQR